MTTTIPTATLEPVTEEARASLGKDASVLIDRFPFRIGRESRSPSALSRLVAEAERRMGKGTQLNELYLIEPAFSQLLQISREHCAIEYVGGEFSVVDRGSACGTTVVAALIDEGRSTIEATQAGGRRIGGRSKLRNGDLIVIGTADSPYVFRFQIRTEPLTA